MPLTARHTVRVITEHRGPLLPVTGQQEYTVAAVDRDARPAMATVRAQREGGEEFQLPVALLHYTGPFSSYAPDDDEARDSIVHGEHESYFKANPARLLELRAGQLWVVHGPGRLAEAETLGYVADWGQFYKLGCWASIGVVSPAAACHAYLPRTEKPLRCKGTCERGHALRPWSPRPLAC